METEALDYREALKATLDQMRGHVMLHNATDDYMINLLNTANDYLFYLEDTSK